MNSTIETESAAPHSRPQELTHEVKFTGNLGDYFRLELKNVALVILTLGIYSAWSKVNRNQFFARHTWVDGHNFEYTANPKTILRSRLIVAAVLISSLASELAYPAISGVTNILIVIATPWALVSSLAFNARNTRHRGHSFSFHGDIKTSYMTCLSMFAIQLLTLGAGLPVVQRKLAQFVLPNLQFGKRPFSFIAKDSPFWKLSGTLALMGLGGILIVLAVCGGSAWALVSLAPDLAMESKTEFGGSSIAGPAMGVFFFTYPFVLAGALFLAGWMRARCAQLIAEFMSFGPHRFECTQRGRELGWIYFSNFFAVLLSLGLAAPWAIIRTRRYRMKNLFVHAQGPLLAGLVPSSASGSTDDPDSHGDAFGDLAVGLDIGI